MWFNMDATNDRDEHIILILSDVEVVQLTEVQKDFSLTDVIMSILYHTF